MMETQKKILTRVRLINWHFFENETVPIGGSTLVSGENTAGKSTRPGPVIASTLRPIYKGPSRLAMTLMSAEMSESEKEPG